MSDDGVSLDLPLAIKVQAERQEKLSGILSDIEHTGTVDRDTAVSIEQISPGLLTAETDINTFTYTPSQTNYQLTVRSLKASFENAGVVAAVITFILGIIGFISLMAIGVKGGQQTQEIKRAAAKLREDHAAWMKNHRERMASWTAAIKDVEEFRKKIQHGILDQFTDIDMFKTRANLATIMVSNGIGHVRSHYVEDIIKLIQGNFVMASSEHHTELVVEIVKHGQTYTRAIDNSKKIEDELTVAVEALRLITENKTYQEVQAFIASKLSDGGSDGGSEHVDSMIDLMHKRVLFKQSDPMDVVFNAAPKPEDDPYKHIKGDDMERRSKELEKQISELRDKGLNEVQTKSIHALTFLMQRIGKKLRALRSIEKAIAQYVNSVKLNQKKMCRFNLILGKACKQHLTLEGKIKDDIEKLISSNEALLKDLEA